MKSLKILDLFAALLVVCAGAKSLISRKRDTRAAALAPPETLRNLGF